MTLVRVSTVAIAAALALAGCNRANDGEDGNATAAMALPDLPATLPLEAGPAQDVGYAPSASDLPDVAPLKLAQVADPGEAYGYADAAYSYDEAIGDAPPDYAFDYEGTDPWAWEGYDGSTMYAEPIDDGYRYYYYRPGEESPYFVRDPYYSYGFAGGLLAAVYALDGGIVPYADYGPRLVYASRYYARGRNLYRFGRQARRRPVIAATWVQRRPVILTARQRWGAGRVRQPLWASYHRANQPRLARYWQPERVRRAADAQRFAGWRQAGFRTPAPARAIPAAWQNQRWARDERRYRPAGDAVRERVAQRQDRRDDQLRDRREDRQALLVERRQDQRQDRRDDARQDRRQDARQERRDDRRQEARQERRQEARDDRREQAQARQQAGRRDEARGRQQQQREAAQTRREQAREQRQAAQGREEAQNRREQQRQAAQQRREEAQQRRQQQSERPNRERAERQQAAERGQAARQERQQQQRAEREQRQREQADRGRREREGAERQQRQQRQAQAQAERQQRQQQMQAERQQRQQAERQQAQQQRAGEQRQQAQQQRQQVREQRQQNRAERREGRGGRD